MFNFKYSLRNRIRNSLELLNGPFRVYGTPQVEVITQSPRKGLTQRNLTLPEMKSGFEAGNLDELPLQVRYEQDRLHLRLPAHTAVQRASLLGWETIWNGFQATLAETQLSIPAYGRWRVCSQTASTEIFVRHPLENLDSALKQFFHKLKEGLRATFSRPFVSAVLAHGAMALLIFSIQNGSLKRVLEMVQPSSQEEQPIAAAGGAAPEIIEVAVEDDAEAFSGRSIFAPPPPPPEAEVEVAKKEETVDKNAISSKLKNLAQLMKFRPQVTSPTSGRPTRTGSGTGNASGAFASLGSLKSVLGGTQMTAPNAQGPRGKPQVGWAPQFMTGNGSGSTVNDTRQLLEAFSKHQDRFRDCYETALLKFDELSVSVNFEGVVSSNGTIANPRFTINGRATPDSKEALTSCLQKVMSQVQVDKKYSGTRVKNQFIFKS